MTIAREAFLVPTSTQPAERAKSPRVFAGFHGLFSCISLTIEIGHLPARRPERTQLRSADDRRLALACSSLESQSLRPDTGSRSLAISNPRRAIMAIQIVMDRTGDSRHLFNPDDARELAKAEQRFYELTKVGFTAAVRTGPGQVSQIRSFDPKAEETVFFPRLVGG
jgi:hypothetical protein